MVALTIRVTAAECDKVPLVPVMVSVYVPMAIVLAVATVSFEVL